MNYCNSLLTSPPLPFLSPFWFQLPKWWSKTCVRSDHFCQILSVSNHVIQTKKQTPYSDLQIMKQFILSLCLSDLWLYFLLYSEHPYSELIPLLSLKTQTIPNTNSSASLHSLALLLWNAHPHPGGIASLSHFLQNFTHVSLSFSHWFFCPVLCSWLPPCFFMLACNLFFFTAMKCFTVWVWHNPLTHCVARYLCCFQCFAIANIPLSAQLLAQNYWIIGLCIFSFVI